MTWPSFKSEGVERRATRFLARVFVLVLNLAAAQYSAAAFGSATLLADALGSVHRALLARRDFPEARFNDVDRKGLTDLGRLQAVEKVHDGAGLQLLTQHGRASTRSMYGVL